MRATSIPCFNFPSIVSVNNTKLSAHVHASFHPTLSFPSSSSLLLTSHLSLDCNAAICLQRRCNMGSRRNSPSLVSQKRKCLLGDDELSAEACKELVNGSDLKIGEGNDAVDAYFVQAVKNKNNGVGILLLSDIFGFQTSDTRDFADRVACIGYNVLVPDQFRGDPWSNSRPQSEFDQWLAEQDPNMYAKDIATSTQWLVDKFMVAESSKKLGIIGFCYGGGRLLEVLARDRDSVFGTSVSFYGTRLDSSVAPNVKVPVLFITGDNDPLSPVDTVKEVRDLIGNSSRVVVFKGRGHSFVHKPQTPEDEADAEKAFKIMRKWLCEQLLEMV